jgi:chromosome transmission fidelity protein 18
LDEVDGADARSSILALVNIIKAERSNSDAKKKDAKTYLRRPIIFICNHKHAPALRPLLPYARIFDVAPPSSNRFVSRLKSVLAVERMMFVGGSSMLHRLVEATGGDIRSCLFTLQFAAARAREIATKKETDDNLIGSKSTLVDITSALSTALGGNGGGMKDSRSDMAGTLMAIFRKVKARAKIRNIRDVERVLDAVEVRLFHFVKILLRCDIMLIFVFSFQTDIWGQLQDIGCIILEHYECILCRSHYG